MPEVLRYRGDIRPVDHGHMLGPDTAGRRLVITGVDYDPVGDMSTVTLRAVLPAEYRERVEPLVAQAQAFYRLQGLFNA